MSLFQVEFIPVCLEVLPKIYLSNKKKFFCLLPESLYACPYNDEWYFGVANYISVENYDVNIKFLQPNGPAVQFVRPSLEGTCWMAIHDTITKVDPPSYGSMGQVYCFDCDEINCVKKLI